MGADGAQFRRAHGAVSHGREDGEDAIDQRSRHQGQQKQGEHSLNVATAKAI